MANWEGRNEPERALLSLHESYAQGIRKHEIEAQNSAPVSLVMHGVMSANLV